MGQPQPVSRTDEGIRALPVSERMSPGVRKLRDAYARVPDAPLYRRRCMELGG